MSPTSQIPDIEDRFLEPDGWRWHNLKVDGRVMRFGSVSPKDSIPDAVVVCLPGLGEFSEKYFEVAQTLLDMNLTFWILDWMGQGKSDRYLKNPHKRHSRGFKRDVNDLNEFIMGYIKHSSVHPDRGRIPLVMLGHSMGANIGMHYLHQYPDMFECAAFTAPMVGLKIFRYMPKFLSLSLTAGLGFVAGKFYVSGGGNWRPDMRPSPGNDRFSCDSVRGSVHNSWCLADPDLQVGRVTYGWINEANKSCARLQNKKLLESIQTHCLIAIAGHEDFVDNEEIREAVNTLPDAELLELPQARHEIFMEQDDTRKLFFEAFHELIKKSIIDRPETLKPF